MTQELVTRIIFLIIVAMTAFDLGRQFERSLSKKREH